MHFIVMRANQAPDLARALSDGQREAMRPFGIDHIVRDETWPDAYLIAAQSEPGHLLGGLRIEQRTPDHRLPLERALGLPMAMQMKLIRRSVIGPVEVCGLWVAEHRSEPGLGDRLVRLGLAVAAADGMAHAVAFCGQHSLPLALRTGFRFGRGEGVVAYPDSRYQSRIVWQRIRR
jgi:hypothetical protein